MFVPFDICKFVLQGKEFQSKDEERQESLAKQIAHHEEASHTEQYFG